MKIEKLRDKAGKLTIISKVGNRYGKLMVISFVRTTESRATKWLCRCDCGNYTEAGGSELLRGKTVSCGCERKKSFERMLAKKKERNIQIHPLYHTWSSMKRRCTDVNYKDYKNYGGRGIKVCDKWSNSFESFVEDVGDRPSKDHSLDRFPNMNGDYEPSNIRWATRKEQCQNKRNNVWIEFNRMRMILQDWSKFLSIRQSQLWLHINKNGERNSMIYYHTKAGIQFKGSEKSTIRSLPLK